MSADDVVGGTSCSDGSDARHCAGSAPSQASLPGEEGLASKDAAPDSTAREREAALLKKELREWLCTVPVDSNRAVVVAVTARTWARFGLVEAMRVVRHAQAVQAACQPVESCDDLFDKCAGGPVA